MIANNAHNVFYVCSHTHSGGIYCFEITDAGELNQISFTYTDRPAYAIINEGKVYALMREAEPMQSGVKSYTINPGFSLTTGETVLTHGAVGAHLCMHKGKIYCVNYLSGSTICLPDKIVLHNGRSIHEQRQTSSHPHQIQPTPDGKYLVVNDLGTDRIEIYTEELGQLKSFVNAPAGSGPRHGIFSPDGKYYYCAGELDSSVSMYRYSRGTLTFIESYTTKPNDFYENDQPSAIRLRGKYLYVSNRASSTIAVYRRFSTRLQLCGFIPVMGSSPRDFDFCGEYLVCGNEDSSSVTVFKMRNDGFADFCSCKEGIDIPWCIAVYPECQ